MIDIHHHLLYGLDDGSKSLEMSIAMAEMAAADGITHIVCTPHASFTYAFDPAENQARLEQIRARIGGKVTLGLGCDFHLSYENIEDALKNATKYTVNGTKYLLVEFADMVIPPRMTQVFYEFLLAGMQPIITHPERNPVIQKTPQRLDEWLQGGCLVQVTASSLTGRFGRAAMSFSQKLLDERKVHFLATDAHDPEWRPPHMKDAFDLVATRYGVATAERLCITNPRAVFYGEELPPQPEPEEGWPLQTKKQSFWSRLMQRP